MEVITVKRKEILRAAYIVKLQKFSKEGLKYCFQRNNTEGPQQQLSHQPRVILNLQSSAEAGAGQTKTGRILLRKDHSRIVTKNKSKTINQKGFSKETIFQILMEHQPKYYILPSKFDLFYLPFFTERMFFKSISHFFLLLKSVLKGVNKNLNSASKINSFTDSLS